MTIMKLVVGTNNAGKIKELNELLADLPIEISGLGEFENIVDDQIVEFLKELL